MSVETIDEAAEKSVALEKFQVRLVIFSFCHVVMVLKAWHGVDLFPYTSVLTRIAFGLQSEAKARTNLAADKLDVAVARFRVDGDHDMLDDSVKGIVGSVRAVTDKNEKYVDLEQLVEQWRQAAGWLIETSCFMTAIQVDQASISLSVIFYARGRRYLLGGTLLLLIPCVRVFGWQLLIFVAVVVSILIEPNIEVHSPLPEPYLPPIYELIIAFYKPSGESDPNSYKTPLNPSLLASPSFSLSPSLSLSLSLPASLSQWRRNRTGARGSQPS